MEQPPSYTNEKENPAPYSPQQQEPQNQGYPLQHYPPQPATGMIQQQQSNNTAFVQQMEQPPSYTNEKENPAQYSPQQQEPQNQGYPLQHYPPQTYPPQGYPPQPPTGMIQQQQSNNTTVVVQNQPQTSAIMVPVVNDHLVLSIFSCLFCPIWPIGLVAIIKSLEVRNLYVTGNYAGAIASAETARKLAGISIGIGIALYVVFTILGIVVSFI
ncbi:trafficking regulator of GLUT4 1-like [Xenia sp. Carnegie-2017]|uniref:trafficking regulator of GLUT4 1-like n=1 Tax=Xenia sp. Carnegie-2017 TaxID=2897299 RepID=UPI001F0449C1|nr:trafficking regulator of GLUT4 1-like [Xenia sp. Carnegie-2017]XP_046856827.1 trafficking regulator of GLUT4 1-like [Xenia sp. Carnegie-2017]XP_046856828.1 trafficking regulator of GLUT4 1-like [Xenia sp. Carnegie-2017]